MNLSPSTHAKPLKPSSVVTSVQIGPNRSSSEEPPARQRRWRSTQLSPSDSSSEAVAVHGVDTQYSFGNSFEPLFFRSSGNLVFRGYGFRGCRLLPQRRTKPTHTYHGFQLEACDEAKEKRRDSKACFFPTFCRFSLSTAESSLRFHNVESKMSRKILDERTFENPTNSKPLLQLLLK